MTTAFDDRLVILQIDATEQSFTFDQSFYILAAGTKFTDGSLGECAVKIDNIAKKTRDYLVEKTSPWSEHREYVNMTLFAGRKSKGTFVMFTGQATASNPSQPPDIGLTFTSLAMSALLGNIGTLNAGATTPLSSIATQIAAQLPNPKTGVPGIPCDYQAKYNPSIRNYSFNGSIIRQIDKLNTMGGINAFIDNNALIVVDGGQPRSGGPRMLNKDTGMIGVPEVNELGVTVKALIQDEIRPGDAVTVQSDINPAANGTYVVYQLGFEVASRDTSFYWNIEMRRYQLGASQ